MSLGQITLQSALPKSRPGTLGTQADPGVQVAGCKVLDVDSASGEVSVLQTAPTFWVHSLWH